jgi:chromosomal replication initiator protein
MGEAAASRLWETSLGQLQLQLTRANYETWLRDTRGLSFDGQRFIVGVPTDFAREWLNSKLRSPAMKAISDVVGSPVEVSFVVGNGALSQVGHEAPEPRRAGKPRANLVSRHSFDSFVVGEANRFAASAALAVAEAPGQVYNPLFIYGGVGQGKTHLLHAVGNKAAAAGLNVLYVPADQFIREFVNSIHRDGEDDFRYKYRSLDVFLLDDFQFLAGKEKTEEGFLHTFNALQNGERQIVITSDRTAKAFTQLGERLRTRLEGGLCVEVRPPDPKLREEFLRRRMLDKGIGLTDDVVDYLSAHFKMSMRELEGGFNQVVAMSTMTGRRVTIELAMEATAGLASPSSRAKPSADRVLGTVCRYFDVTMEQLRDPTREKGITYARQVAMLLLRDDCLMPLAEIGKLLGDRDHSTVLHGANKISAAARSEQQVRYDLHELRQVLSQPLPQVS